MSRLVVVSNRVALPEEGRQAAGGLAVAVLDALRESGGIWFGWSGQLSENGDGDGEAPPVVRMQDAGPITYATLDLSKQDYEEYYNGFANSTLWPLFHYRLGLIEISRRTTAGYERVNARFAGALVPLLQPDDLIWVQDYHLIPLGQRLRQLGGQQRMGFFLHTPFPAPELLVALPSHAALMRALCAYDLVGFHTEGDLRCFINYLRFETESRLHRLPGGRSWQISAFGRTLVAGVFPISIDTAGYVALAEAQAQAPDTLQLKESLVGRDLIIGVDRLDYSKGLPQRFEAFHLLLENHPEYRGRVSLMQIAPPSREEVPEYIAIRRELETAAGHTNGRFAEFDWVPIRYLNKSFDRATLAGFYRTARIGLVTPLRDGMNLVAKEYVACQDPRSPGVLVLSRFAGAAAELDAALIVNPFDIDSVADALNRALTMPLDERRERHRAMMRVLTRHDVAAWRESFVAALAGPPAAPGTIGRHGAVSLRFNHGAVG